MNDAILSIRDLSIDYTNDHGRLHALRNVDLDVEDGKVLGIVGESGCGKSTLAAAINCLLPRSAEHVSGEVRFRGRNLMTLGSRELRSVRSREMAMIFQDPMTTFNPVKRIGRQIADFMHHRSDLTRTQKREAIVEMFGHVGIADAAERVDGYPHEFSGGMRQRMSVAAALLVQPRLLIADEPTTALDVTMEAQIIHLLRELSQEFSGAIIVISHQLGVIAQLCDRVAVMYAGEIAEEGPVEDIFYQPHHPYTKALLACDPAALSEARIDWLPTIEGEVPDLFEPPLGCPFAPRCPSVMGICRERQPQPVRLTPNHVSRCHLDPHGTPA